MGGARERARDAIGGVAAARAPAGGGGAERHRGARAGLVAVSVAVRGPRRGGGSAFPRPSSLVPGGGTGGGGAGVCKAGGGGRARAWWSGATRKVSDPRAGGGWGRGGTGHASPGGAADTRGSGQSAAGLRWAGEGRLAPARSRPLAAWAARGALLSCPQPPGYVTCDLPFPFVMARPAPRRRRLHGRPAPTPGAAALPPALPTSRWPGQTAPQTPSSCAGASAGHSVPRHSFARAFGR